MRRGSCHVQHAPMPVSCSSELAGNHHPTRQVSLCHQSEVRQA